MKKLNNIFFKNILGYKEDAVKQQELFKAVVDNIPAMITYYDPSIKMLMVNKEFTRLTGWTSEEAQKVDLMAECYPDPKIREEAKNFMAKCEGWHDFPVTDKNGFVVESSWTNVRLADGRQIGIGIDISARKKTEEALKESEERFRSIFDKSGVAKALTRPDGKLLRVNQAFADLVGYSIKEMEKINFSKITYPDDIAISKESIRSLLANEQRIFRFEKRYIQKKRWYYLDRRKHNFIEK